MVRPSGTVTFLFTGVEGSTRRWEEDPEAMRAALAAHDDVLRAAVDAHEGWPFKHTGDGVCAAFSAAGDAVAAVDAQRRLGLPVRMGIGTGSAELRGEDYFGPTLNRTARVMAVGHGGQVLVAASAAALLDDVDLADLGEHRLLDLSGAHRLFQVRADGLGDDFPALRTVDAVPGNLPVLPTSFVGRDVDVKELVDVVRAHRLVTLTGVGGVGKTRLALQVAAEMTGEFPDGVWLVELAPVGEAQALPDAVATALGVAPQAGMSVTAGVAQALSGRRMLVVLDNCEHVLDAAADLVETVLARASTLTVIATSREGLGAGAERLWPVSSLDVEAGTTSAAVELFVERARAVNPGFGLDTDIDADLGPDVDAAAVTEICARLDGIPLAIELAAARMVSMTPEDVRDRLGDRFRLLSGGRRGLERHQTLRHAVSWSYDLLDDDERTLLNRCSVFAGGFDLPAAVHLDDDLDEYAVLDGLDSLVRKSLVTVDRVGGRARYGQLETVRQFGEDQLAASGSIEQVRDRHAAHYATQGIAHWQRWDGPDQRIALDWIDAELGNLRAAFRWATVRGDVATAAAIAAHSAVLGFGLQRFEPVGWAEELLPAATTAGLAQLPRLYVAASLCSFTGRPEPAVGYARAAVALEVDPRCDPFPEYWSHFLEALAHVFAGGVERGLEVFADLGGRTGTAHVCGRCGELLLLPHVGRGEEARAIGPEALAAAQAHANPFFIAWSLHAFAMAHTRIDPGLALDTLSRALDYARDHRLPLWERIITREAARVEAAHGDADRALTLYDEVIGSNHQGGNVANLATTLASLAVFLDRLQRPEIATTLHGAATHISSMSPRIRPDVLERLRSVLGDVAFERCVAAGAAMELAEAVRYAREQIQLARHELRAEGARPGVVP